jgi:anti-sigma regulatory factor (Ser/Thr protein kinase)
MSRATSCVQYRPSSETPSLARHAVDSFLAGRIDDDLLSELLLVTSELVTNAVTHGSRSDPVWVHLLLLTDEVAITVSSVSADGEHVARDARLAEPSAETGRGLAIVRELCDEVAVYDGRFTFVRVVRHLL